MRLNARTPLLVLCLLLLAVATSTALAAVPTPAVRTVLNYDALHPGQQAVVVVEVAIPKGYHAQSDKPLDENLIPFSIEVEPNDAIDLFPIQYPPGHVTEYPMLGKMSVYDGIVVAYVPVQVKQGAAPGAITIRGTLTYQICDDKTCFAPRMPAFEVATNVVPTSQPIQPANAELFKGFDPTVFSQATPAVAAGSGKDASFSVFGMTVKADSYLLAFSVALLVGMIFNVMPCVLPVLPLKVLSFYEVSQHDRAKSLLLGTVFSLGMIATFAVLAALVLVFNQAWGEMFAQAWFVWAMTVLLVVMAMSLFGFFTFRLPMGAYSWQPRHDTVSGNFLFGGFTALLSTPCTGPIFPPLLTWAAAQPQALGFGIIVMVGVGMALPYLVLSAFPELARKLPRTGPWSEIVKQMMGWLLLAVAAYFLGARLIPGQNFWWPVYAVLAASAVFLVVRTYQLMPRRRPMLVSGVVALLLVAGGLLATLRLTDKGDWTPYTSEAFAAAIDADKVVLVKFTANWCANCQYIEHAVYPDDRARAALKQHGVVMLKADLTRRDAPGWDLLKKLNPSGGIPLTAIYPPQSNDPIQLASIYTVNDLVTALDQADSQPVAAR